MSSASQQYILNNYSSHFSVAVINITPLQARKNDNHAIVGIFGIAVTVLLTALQLKYQAKTVSPFQDHPTAMAIAVGCFLMFCLACDLEQYFYSTRGCFSTYVTILHHVQRIVGFISLASLACVIFSTNLHTSLIVYLVFPLVFSMRQMLYLIQNRSTRGNRGANNLNNLYFAFVDNLDYIDTLPVYHIAPANIV